MAEDPQAEEEASIINTSNFYNSKFNNNHIFVIIIISSSNNNNENGNNKNSNNYLDYRFSESNTTSAGFHKSQTAPSRRHYENTETISGAFGFQKSKSEQPKQEDLTGNPFVSGPQQPFTNANKEEKGHYQPQTQPRSETPPPRPPPRRRLISSASDECLENILAPASLRYENVMLRDSVLSNLRRASSCESLYSRPPSPEFMPASSLDAKTEDWARKVGQEEIIYSTIVTKNLLEGPTSLGVRQTRHGGGPVRILPKRSAQKKDIDELDSRDVIYADLEFSSQSLQRSATLHSSRKNSASPPTVKPRRATTRYNKSSRQNDSAVDTASSPSQTHPKSQTEEGEQSPTQQQVESKNKVPKISFRPGNITSVKDKGRESWNPFELEVEPDVPRGRRSASISRPDDIKRQGMIVRAQTLPAAPPASPVDTQKFGHLYLTAKAVLLGNCSLSDLKLAPPLTGPLVVDQAMEHIRRHMGKKTSFKAVDLFIFRDAVVIHEQVTGVCLHRYYVKDISFTASSPTCSTRLCFVTGTKKSMTSLVHVLDSQSAFKVSSTIASLLKEAPTQPARERAATQAPKVKRSFSATSNSSGGSNTNLFSRLRTFSAAITNRRRQQLGSVRFHYIGSTQTPVPIGQEALSEAIKLLKQNSNEDPAPVVFSVNNGGLNIVDLSKSKFYKRRYPHRCVAYIGIYKQDNKHFGIVTTTSTGGGQNVKHVCHLFCEVVVPIGPVLAAFAADLLTDSNIPLDL
eukprot:m.161725 g.161725  ORF g.161725 m.161725 type:complete len:744 (-) comp24863_c0_seq4:30-2261(-)